jgi:hypothetical protein
MRPMMKESIERGSAARKRKTVNIDVYRSK